MPTEGDTEIGRLIAGWKAGEPGAFDRLVELAYPELRRIAHQQLGRRRPGESLESVALAKELKRRGFRFIGPTTAYAAMQACGLVDDHVATCPVAARTT